MQLRDEMKTAEQVHQGTQEQVCVRTCSTSQRDHNDITKLSNIVKHSHDKVNVSQFLGC